ncbi:hypothetical protein [Streptomyces avicenniae]|uniref:hypothetical protein n=1 Tax=Streptomyces avicenniae TaxID=500153 RepID=UPI000DA5EF23|nr:hypothetical protein [Streptomyces avicenniae]
MVVLAALGGYAYAQFVAGPGSEPAHCLVTAAAEGGEPYRLEPQQAANAATIEAVASVRGLPERAVTIALATAMQESALRNIDYGDRDSLGLFQQRPSQGWGTEEQVMDPVYAAGQFYDHLVEVPDYETLPLTVAAQAVQRSAFPDEYAKHEPRATLLSGALTGRAPASLTCVPDEPGAGDGAEGDEGRADGGATAAQLAEAAAAGVTARLVRDFGPSADPRGEGADVTVPVPDEGGERRGWELAHWAVAHSGELGITRVAYAGRVWEADSGADGWREENAGENAAGPPSSVLISVSPAGG